LAVAEPFVHETAVVDEGAVLGEGTRVWHFSHVSSGARLGARCVLGQNVFVGPGVAIGDGVKIQNNVSVYSGVTLEDDVFLGPSCVFTNVLTPRAHVERKDEFAETRVGRGATVGANATIVCGHDLGEYSLIGAGAVVTREVPPHAVVVGNPARRFGWACRCGEVLLDTGVCPRCADTYEIEGERCVRVGGDD
jgi:UDP-2-acetamido-3-amino-2,3-dideoxy-glucuronate N-acetyltransferase